MNSFKNEKERLNGIKGNKIMGKGNLYNLENIIKKYEKKYEAMRRWSIKKALSKNNSDQLMLAILIMKNLAKGIRKMFDCAAAT
jgi:hypothetical protein